MTAATSGPVTPALYEATVAHRRSERVDYGFTHQLYLWLVDLDALPRWPWAVRPLAGFRAADHVVGPGEDPRCSIRANLETFLSERGVDLAGGRVLMLAHARVLGYVFNPLTLYWCHRPDGTLACVVAEVHNTYGGRHRYLLSTDDADASGTVRVDKEFYVSPFFTVDGEYRMRVPEPDDSLAVSIVLRRDEDTAFVATLRGTRRPADVRGLLRAARDHPWVTLRLSAAIRRHGIALWRRGVPVVPRTADHRRPTGVS